MNIGKNADMQIVTWEETYKTKIPYIDNQHKELINLINELYQACMTRQTVGTTFEKTMHKMVDYVHFHFSAELVLLGKINYPMLPDHKAQHNSLVKQILEAEKEYEAGNKYTPNQFVRTLKDWVLSHIAITDKLYATYVADQVAKGRLNMKDLVV